MNLPVWLTTSYLALLPTGEEDILFSFMLICTYRPVRHQECWTHTLNIWSLVGFDELALNAHPAFYVRVPNQMCLAKFQ
jgi:hypothetical protein